MHNAAKIGNADLIMKEYHCLYWHSMADACVGKGHDRGSGTMNIGLFVFGISLQGL